MTHSYYIVFSDYGRAGLEGIAHPENTRRDIVDMVQRGEFPKLAFIHYVHNSLCDDVTEDVLNEANKPEDDHLINLLRAS